MLQQLLPLAIVVAVIPMSASADYAVECEGYNSETSAHVTGECTNGEFEGHDTETDNYVYGDCEFSGDLEAYDSETGEFVSGECEGE